MQLAETVTADPQSLDGRKSPLLESRTAMPYSLQQQVVNYKVKEDYKGGPLCDYEVNVPN